MCGFLRKLGKVLNCMFCIQKPLRIEVTPENRQEIVGSKRGFLLQELQECVWLGHCHWAVEMDPEHAKPHI